MIQMLHKKFRVRYKIVMMHKGKFRFRIGLVITDIDFLKSIVKTNKIVKEYL